MVFGVEFQAGSRGYAVGCTEPADGRIEQVGTAAEQQCAQRNGMPRRIAAGL
jgi:hypothetical protein